MRIGILTFLAVFVMSGVSYASDVYITQSGASFTANINQDGQTNKYGQSGPCGQPTLRQPDPQNLKNVTFHFHLAPLLELLF